MNRIERTAIRMERLGQRKDAMDRAVRARSTPPPQKLAQTQPQPQQNKRGCGCSRG